MKSVNLLGLLAIFLIVSSCKKDSDSNPGTGTLVTYSSVADFYIKNAPSIQTYTINASTGGSFTTPQGTTVTVPVESFVTLGGSPVIGNVIIQFKDLYKKSDMLLSNVATTTVQGHPLKSGGEFFIKALQNGVPIMLADGKEIEVALQADLTGMDSVNVQEAFVMQMDSGGFAGWAADTFSSVYGEAQSYVYGLYQFNSPASAGTWCNSDNSSYFSAYPQTSISFVPSDAILDYDTQVFLVFETVHSMVHVYRNWQGNNEFLYDYAPQGLECTMVAFGVKEGKLYSAFKPVTIGPASTFNFSLTETTTVEFKEMLKSLD
jgi:hypothetical protein